MKPTMLFVAALLAPVATAQTVVVWFQTPYPSLPGGGQLLQLIGQDQFIASDGSVVFGAVFDSQPVLCRATPAGPVIIARRGDPAPGIPASTFESFDSVISLPGQRAAYRAILNPQGHAVYLDRGAGPELCLRTGEAVPGHPLQITSFSDLASNGDTVTILARTGAGTTPSAWGHWIGQPGAMSLLAHTGDPAPGMGGPPYGTFYNAPAIRSGGGTTFDATTPSPTFLDGIWSGNPPALELRTGDPAPGLPGLTLRYVFNPVLNSAGDMVFAGTTGQPSQRRGVWRMTRGKAEPVALQGDPAPGTTAVFSSFGPEFGPTTTLLTDQGVVVFSARLAGSGVTPANNTGIWAGTPGAVRLIARTGDPAPGMSGHLITDLRYPFGGEVAFAADGRGNIVFFATVATQGVQVFCAAPGVPTRRIVGIGSTLELQPGGPDTVRGIGLPRLCGSPLSGRRSFLGSNGELLLYLDTFHPFQLTRDSLVKFTLPPPCYANCDGSSAPPLLNVQDFSCFLSTFAAGDPSANCDQSTTPPVLNVRDFACFLNAFAAGCS